MPLTFLYYSSFASVTFESSSNPSPLLEAPYLMKDHAFGVNRLVWTKCNTRPQSISWVFGTHNCAQAVKLNLELLSFQPVIQITIRGKSQLLKL